MTKRLLLWGVFLCARYLWFVSAFRWAWGDQATIASLRELQRESFWIHVLLRKMLPADINYCVIVRRGADVSYASDLRGDDVSQLLTQALAENAESPDEVVGAPTKAAPAPA